MEEFFNVLIGVLCKK